MHQLFIQIYKVYYGMGPGGAGWGLVGRGRTGRGGAGWGMAEYDYQRLLIFI